MAGRRSKQLEPRLTMIHLHKRKEEVLGTAGKSEGLFIGCS